MSLRKLSYFVDSWHRNRTGTRLSAIRSGFMDLDQLIGGARCSELLFVVSNDESASAFCGNLARNAALGHNARVLLANIGVSSAQVAKELLSSEAGVGLSRIDLGALTDAEEVRLMHAASILSSLDLHLHELPTVSVDTLMPLLKQFSDDIGGPDLVLVNIAAPEGLMWQGSGDQVKPLKRIARELDVPIIVSACAAVDLRLPFPLRRLPANLGSIEQDADVVMFIYREDVYVTREEWETRNFDQPYPEGITKIIVAKHRNGPTGVVHLRSRSHLSRFEDLMVLEEESA